MLAALCGSAQAATTNTFYLYNLASGNWNSANQRMDDNYQVGHSYALNGTTTDSAGYFIYDFSPIKQWFGAGTIGLANINSASMTVIGSADFHMSTGWPGHTGYPWFKIGCTPMNTNLNTVSQVMTGNNISGLYNNQVSKSPNGKDAGYAWVSNGLHPGLAVDCWHYESVGSTPPRLTGACNAGGLFAIFQGSRFDAFYGTGTGEDGQNYVWGSTGFDPNNFVKITIWK